VGKKVEVRNFRKGGTFEEYSGVKKQEEWNKRSPAIE